MEYIGDVSKEVAAAHRETVSPRPGWTRLPAAPVSQPEGESHFYSNGECLARVWPCGSGDWTFSSFGPFIHRKTRAEAEAAIPDLIAGMEEIIRKLRAYVATEGKL